MVILVMERFQHLTKPACFSKIDALENLLEGKYTAATIRKIQEKIKETVQVSTSGGKLEEKIRDLSGKKSNLETSVSELKAKNLSWDKHTCEMKAKIQNLMKNRIALKEKIELMLMKKKQAELDKENAQNELIRVNDAFIKGAAHYKRKLDIRVELGKDENVTVQFLNICTPDGSACSAVLNYTEKIWELLELSPDLTCKAALAQHLQKTQDIQGLLVQLRKLFAIRVQKTRW